MKQHASSTLNSSRIILYLTTLILCSVGGYLIFVVIPRWKEERVKAIEKLYQKKDYEVAIKHCQEYISDYSKEPHGYLWLGRCYDALALELKQLTTLAEKYRKNAKNNYYSAAQQKILQDEATNFEKNIALLKKIAPQEGFLPKTLQLYQKTSELSTLWHTGIEIVKSHNYVHRTQEAYNLIEKLPQPKNPEESTYHALIQLEVYYRLNGEKKLEDQKLIEQCDKTIELYGKIAKEDLPEKLLLNQALPHIYLAEIAKRTNKLPEALKHYQKAISYLPARPSVFEEIGKLLYSSGKYAESKEMLATAVFHYQKNLQSRARLFASQNVFLQAINTMTLRKKLANAYYLFSKNELQLWNFSMALSSLEKALFLEIEDSETSIYNKVLKEKEWRAYDYHPEFQLVMGWPQKKLANNYDKQLQRKALHYLRSRKLDPAVYIGQIMLKRDPKCYSGYFIILHCLLAQKSYKLGWDLYFKETRKKLKEEKLNIDQKETLKKKLADAEKVLQSQNLDKFDLKQNEQYINQVLNNIRDLDKSFTSELNIVDAYFRASMFGGANQKVTYYSEVAKMLEKLLPSLKNKHLQAYGYHLQGFSYMQLKDFEKSRIHLAKSIEIAPEIPYYHYDLARVSEKLNDNANAAIQYQKASEIAKAPFMYNRIGKELLRLNRLDDAQKQFEAGVALAPKKNISWYFLAKTHLLKKDNEKALKILEQAFKNQVNTGQLLMLIEQEKIWQPLRQHPELMRILDSSL